MRWSLIFTPMFESVEVPDTVLSCLPFVDESHGTVYEECESLSATQLSWGAMKALYG